MKFTRKEIPLVERLFDRFLTYYGLMQRHLVNDVTVIPPLIKEQIDKLGWIEWQRKTLTVLTCKDSVVVAVAVGEVLRLMGIDVLYHYNGQHVYLSVMVNRYDRSGVFVSTTHTTQVDRVEIHRRVWFDSFNPRGTLIEADLLKPPHPRKLDQTSGNVEWITGLLMSHDWLGRELVELFVSFYHPDYTYPFLTKGERNTLLFSEGERDELA